MEEGNDQTEPTRTRVFGNRFQRRSMSRVKKSRRSVRDHCHDDSDWLPDCCQIRGLVRLRKGSDELPKRLQSRTDLKPFREDSKDHSRRGSGSGFRVTSRPFHGRGEWSFRRLQTSFQASRTIPASNVSEAFPRALRDSVSGGGGTPLAVLLYRICVVSLDYAALRSNDCTSPPTYERTSILSRDNRRTDLGDLLRIGGR